MKRIIATILVATMLFTLVGCSTSTLGGIDVKQITAINDVLDLSEYEYSASTLSESTLITGNYSTLQGCLMFTTETVDSVPKMNVYNLKTETKLGTYDFANIVLSSSGYGIFFVIENGNYSVYNASGERISTIALTGSLTPSYVSADIFMLDGKYYTVNDDYVTTVVADSPNGYELFDYENNGYKYTIYSSSSIVIAKDGKEPVSYFIPSYAEDSYIGILSNGDVFIQYIYRVSAYDEYDFAYPSYNYYYKMVTATLSPSGKVSEIDFPYYVSSIANKISNKKVWESSGMKIDNLMSATVIDNKLLSTYVTVSLTNGLKVEGAFSTDDSDFSVINKDRALVKLGNQDFVYDAKGGFVGQVSSEMTAYTANYFIVGNTIFDWDLKMVGDASGYDYYTKVGENLVFTKDADTATEVYIFDGSFEKISDDYITIRSNSTLNYIYVRTTTGYKYFNESATELASTFGEINIVYTVDGYAYGYTITDTGVYKYYKLTFSSAVPMVFYS